MVDGTTRLTTNHRLTTIDYILAARPVAAKVADGRACDALDDAPRVAQQRRRLPVQHL